MKELSLNQQVSLIAIEVGMRPKVIDSLAMLHSVRNAAIKTGMDANIPKDFMEDWVSKKMAELSDIVDEAADLAKNEYDKD